jgi:hypothetical protein
MDKMNDELHWIWGYLIFKLTFLMAFYGIEKI